ncbi:hypothetical protein KIPE111705_23040 [Kibdelosporangium persicum]|uniref:X-Pro dipeptidyl-peptidase n=1 Tax=Kibdelosporangium persicum TaxID=2698649 RepID=A0ABX2FJP6_9PSEU|nr:hypothetical protein [Kibdelosporangium persicum]NRN70993.1 X-Pro dipeptidyl-peptidase [Kibdelosporangium persicum]
MADLGQLFSQLAAQALGCRLAAGTAVEPTYELFDRAGIDEAYARLSHEVPFDQNGNVAPTNRVLPKTLPPDADPITRIFFDYYRTDRGFHPRSINSTTAWTATTPMSFFAFPLMTNIDMLAPRKALLVAGADAHSRYYSEDVQAMAPAPSTS